MHLSTSDIHNKRQYEEFQVVKSKFGLLVSYNYHWTEGQSVSQKTLRQDAERGMRLLPEATDRFHSHSHMDNIVSSKIIFLKAVIKNSAF